jgi:uncharacterized protein involved in exopolysaccharide biosynthesis/Mrp family chromosome partitioning ATPase
MFLDFRDLLYVVRQQFRLIALVVAIGLGLGIAYLLLSPKQYTAVAEIVFETRSQKVSNIEAVLPGLTSDRSVIESQIEILTSRPVFDRAVELLRGKPKMERTASGDVTTVGKQGPEKVLAILDEVLASETALAAFRGGLEIERRGLSYIVAVEFTHESPEMASVMSNAIVDSYIDIQREEKVKATRWASQQLQGRVRKVGEEVQTVLAKLQKFKSDNSLIKIGELELSERLLSDHINKMVDAKVRAIQAETTAIQIKQSAGDSNRLTALSNVLSSEVILEFRRQYAQVKRRLGEAISRFGTNHITVQNARAELQNLEREIDLEVERLIKSSLNELDMARQQVVLLTKGMEELKDVYASRNDARIELSEIERQAAAKQQLYVSLFNRLLETEIQVGLQADDARINTYAEPPEQPSWPKNKLVLAMLLLVSSVLGFGIGLLRETLNGLFRTSRDVATFTGAEAVAEFPQMVISGARTSWVKNRLKTSTSIDHTRFDPGSQFTRALVKLRKWVQSVCRNDGPISILVASTQNGDGRSMVASNLAQIEGRRGRRVLLIDCSGGKPEGIEGARLERYPVVYDAEVQASDMGPSLGQSQLICFRYAGADYDKAFCDPQTIADETIVRYVYEAGERYDTIILDTPALKSFAHTTSLIEYCDCTLFVIRAGVTNRDEYFTTFGQFVNGTDRAVGYVINMTEREKAVVRQLPRDPEGDHPAVAQPDRDGARGNRSAQA